MKSKILPLAILAVILICLAVALLFFLIPKEEAPEKLTLSNYPNLFEKEVVIVIGENATQMEYESAEAIAEDLYNSTGNMPVIRTDAEIAADELAGHNLILAGSPGSNMVLVEMHNMTDAIKVTDEYPGENKGILEILRNPWKDDVIFSGYARAVALLPHTVVSHTKGEDGADFRIDMHDPHTWNASINNTGNVTLTNVRVITGEKVIQEIPELKAGEQKKLVILQSWEYPANYMLYIVCDQGVREEIELSHTTSGLPLPRSAPYNKFKWIFALSGIILSTLGFIGGILARKNRKLSLFYRIVFCIGILFLVWVGLSYICLLPG